MTTNSDGAWELPHEFRQMQETARRFMRERVVPAEKPLPHDAIALPDEVLKPLQEEAKKLGFWHVESPVRMGRRGAEPARAGDRRGGVLAVQDGPLYPGLSCLRLRPAEFDLPRPQGSDREIRGAGDCERRQDLRRNLGAERRRRSWPRDPDARREARRPLCPQRHQAVDHRRRTIELGPRVRAHRREGPRRCHLVHRREEVQGLFLQAGPGDPLVLPVRDQLSGLRGAGGKPPRQRGRRASSSPRPGWSTRAFPTRRR